MKNTILFFFLLLAAAVSAQSNSFVTDRLRAAEYFRIGSNTSQKVTGFDRVITAPAAHDSLPTSRAVVDFLQANFTPIGYYTAGDGISISDDVITNAAPDQVVGLTGGGIAVSGTYPNFTLTAADQSATNELQTLSIDGSDLTLSNGGGTVTLPGGASDALGTGFTGGGGDGTIPGANVVISGGDLNIDNQASVSISMGDVQGNGQGIGLRLSDITFQFGNPFGAGNYSVISNIDGSDNFISIQTPDKEFKFDATSAKFYDLRATPIGLEYAAEYPDILTNDRSLPDVGTVNLLKQTPVSYTNAAAPNNTIFYSTTDSKLSYKDPAGVVHNLY